eukprot:1161027-Pelagomonas_calceolata.AAC.1
MSTVAYSSCMSSSKSVGGRLSIAVMLSDPCLRRYPCHASGVITASSPGLGLALPIALEKQNHIFPIFLLLCKYNTASW